MTMSTGVAHVAALEFLTYVGLQRYGYGGNTAGGQSAEVLLMPSIMKELVARTTILSPLSVRCRCRSFLWQGCATASDVGNEFCGQQ